MRASGQGGSGGSVPMCTAETFAVVAIDYHPSGRLLATADGHRVPLWDAATGDCQSVIEPAHGAQALAFIPDGSRLAIGGSRLTLVDPSTGVADAGRVTFPADRLIVWAPDGRGVLSASKDGWIHVHDTPGLAERFRLRCRTPGGTGRLTFSTDPIGAGQDDKSSVDSRAGLSRSHGM